MYKNFVSGFILSVSSSYLQKDSDPTFWKPDPETELLKSNSDPTKLPRSGRLVCIEAFSNSKLRAFVSLIISVIFLVSRSRHNSIWIRSRNRPGKNCIHLGSRSFSVKNSHFFLHPNIDISVVFWSGYHGYHVFFYRCMLL